MPITQESLPYPIVQYPCGAFIAFKLDIEEGCVFCSCMYEAIENYIQIRIIERGKEFEADKERYESFKQHNPERTFVLDSWDFGGSIVNKLIEKKVDEDLSIIKYIKFADKLCHECNQATPTAVYCHPMYGGKFKQKYGWYINKKRYELGLNKNNELYLPDRCPAEIKEIIDFRYIDLYSEIEEYNPKHFKSLPYWHDLLTWCDSKYDSVKHKRSRKLFMHGNDAPDHLLPLEFLSKYYCKDCNKIASIQNNNRLYECNQSIGDRFEPLYYNACFIYHTIIYSVIQRRYRKVNRIIENETRQAFGMKKIGEAWTSETILYTIVKRLLPNYDVMRHYRPGILEGLELDIYIKELNIGIEYQGIQHFKAVKHWGGKEGLKKTRERDKRKADLCALNVIKLIYFDHTENLSEELVKSKIEKA